MKPWRGIPAMLAAVPLALAMSAGAQAQAADGYLNDDVTLRAGPAPEYPGIEGLPYGTYVSVQGCTEGWVWCDVITGPGDRGWVPGDYIDYIYEGEPVIVTTYGPRIGIPVVTFSIATYWNTYYRDRPFYRERSTWFHRDIPRHAPAPPHHASHRKPPPPPPGGWHHGGRSSQSRHHERSAPPRHRAAAPEAPRATVSEPERPRGDHHANIPTPPPPAAPPRHAKAHAPPHSRAAKHAYPASNGTQGKSARKHKHKKGDHDHDDDNGH